MFNIMKQIMPDAPNGPSKAVNIPIPSTKGWENSIKQVTKFAKGNNRSKNSI